LPGRLLCLLAVAMGRQVVVQDGELPGLAQRSPYNQCGWLSRRTVNQNHPELYDKGMKRPAEALLEGPEASSRLQGRSTSVVLESLVESASATHASTSASGKLPLVSVIVPTYNRPRALRLSLLSLAQQSMLPSEVLIADDGSGDETKAQIEELQVQLEDAFPIRHVWQEDIGFRKPRILNETVRQATGDYLIFIDGDCMAHRDFVRSHVAMSSPDSILSGKRVDIGRRLTEQLLGKGHPIVTLRPILVWDAVAGGEVKSRKVEEAIRIENALLRKALHRDRITDDGVWGCNFSIYKDLFYAINGCDEDFLDGSIEDNDLGIRVLNQGKRVRSVRNYAVIFHLWHKSSWSFENEKYQHNLAILKQRIANREPRCRNGIRKIV